MALHPTPKPVALIADAIKDCTARGDLILDPFLGSGTAVIAAGARFNAKTLEVLYRGKSIADVLAMTVDAATEFLAEEPHIPRSLQVLQEVGLGYSSTCQLLDG